MYTLNKHLGYTVWATTKLSQILENVDESLLKKETPSSFNTIEKTILHIWDAELVWLKRLQGESLTEWPSKSFTGDKGALLIGWLQNAIDLRDFVAAKGSEYLQSQINYRNMQGVAFSNTVERSSTMWSIMVLFTEVRSSRCCAANGFTDVSSTDLITYLRETKI
jgi:uncharacterized damage-inducible protein DinB